MSYLILVFLPFVLSQFDDSNLFIETPQNVTTLENTTAIFNCSLNNSYVPYWYFNGTDAAYTVSRMKGVDIIPITRSSNQLAVQATKSNNNTNVSCEGILYIYRDPFVFEQTERKTAYLTISNLQIKQNKQNKQKNIIIPILSIILCMLLLILAITIYKFNTLTGGHVLFHRLVFHISR